MSTNLVDNQIPQRLITFPHLLVAHGLALISRCQPAQNAVVIGNAGKQELDPNVDEEAETLNTWR